MKVKSEKKEKSQALGYILSLAAMAAMVALFAEFFGQDRRKGGGDSQEGSGKGFGPVLCH